MQDNQFWLFFQTLQGGDENDTSESENDDNLDWLPDPDKIYGESTNQDLEQKDISEEESDDEG